MKKIYSVVGARPQFIKVAAIAKAFKGYFDHQIIHTGQHYDYNMSKSFFDELEIPEPIYNLEIGSGTAGYMIGNMLIKMEEIFLKDKPDFILVYGDTNSTAAASIAAAKCLIKFGHVEAGLREFDKTIPEETNKLITDILCDYYLCPTQTGVDILKTMGITQDVYNVGDVMIDLIHNNMERIIADPIVARLGLRPKHYVFVTCHRAANTENIDNLRNILEALNEIDTQVIFPIHPRTRKVIAAHNLTHLIENDKIMMLDPIGFFETQALIHHAHKTITDSGGVTKETYFHRVPGILTDTQTEWVETIQEGWNIQAGPHKEAIVTAYKKEANPTIHTSFMGDGRASEKIREILLKAIG